jgi:DNA-binding PadR family transcriptional regulator
MSTGRSDIPPLTDKAYWRQLASRGLGRFLLLAALYERPRHGYELARAIATGCDGCCEPTDAMIYPTVHELLEGGYLVCHTERQGGRARKVCALTERGRAAYRAAAEVWSAILPGLERAVAMGLQVEPQPATEQLTVGPARRTGRR